MPTPEGRLAAFIMKWLKSRPRTFVRKITDMNNVGFPDIAGCHNGQAFYFEVKTANGKVSEKQKFEILKIQAAGGRAAVVRNITEVVTLWHLWFPES